MTTQDPAAGLRDPLRDALAKVLHEKVTMPGHAYPGAPWNDACDELADQLLDEVRAALLATGDSEGPRVWATAGCECGTCQQIRGRVAIHEDDHFRITADYPGTDLAGDSEGPLDGAWAAAVAARPGWSFSLSPYWDEGRWWGWEIEAHHYSYEFDNNRDLSTGTLGAFPTPEAALHALAARLSSKGYDKADHAAREGVPEGEREGEETP